MCPEASARTRIPTAAMAKPPNSDGHVGRANQRYAAANTKPRGTRERVATRDQLGMARSQQMAGRGDDFFRRDLHQAGFRFSMMGKSSFALRMAQRDGCGAERPGARRIGWAVETHHRNVQRRRKMQRAGITADEDAGPARERNQLPNGAPQLECIAAACRHNRAGQFGFLRRGVYQGLDVVRGQRPGHLAKPQCGPLLCSPSRARIDDSEARNAKTRDFRFSPCFRSGINGELRSVQFQFAIAKNWMERLRSQRKVLFDHVFTLPRKLFPVKNTRSGLARIFISCDYAGAAQLCEKSRLDGALEIQRVIVIDPSHSFEGTQYFCCGGRAKEM